MSDSTHLKIIVILAVLLCGISPQSVYGQEILEQITNIFEFDIGKERQDSTFRHNKIVLAPITSYEPNTSWGFGVGVKLLFKPLGAGSNTRTSNIPISVQYTLKNQFILTSEYTIFFPDEAFLLKGNIGYSKFPIGYFGVGSLTQDADQIDISFDNFLFEPLFLRNVRPNLFVGGGWRINNFSGVKFLEEEASFPGEVTARDSLASSASGAVFGINLDSRDNVLNASKGVFAEFTYSIYNKTIGSSNTFIVTQLDFRKYWTSSTKRPNDILALQLFTRLSWGDVPALELSQLGGAELLRGFREGRFRDQYAVFGQVEYRWQALDRIGFTFFGGIGDVTSDLSNLSFSNLKYSLGTGLRLKIVKSENLNIRIDYAHGFGTSSDRNFYLGIAEAF